MIIGKRLKKILLILFLFVYTFAQAQILPTKSYADTPTPTDTPTVTVTASPAPTDSTTPTQAPSNTPTVSPTSSPSPTTTASPTPSETTTPTIDPSTATGTPTPSITVNTNNNATVNNNVTSGGDSGNNTIATPSATPTDDPSATDSATPTATPTGSLTPTPNPTSQTNGSGSNNSIQTGNATATTSVVNTANTNVVNSQVVYQTLNIFVDSVGDLDLSQPFKLAENIIGQNNNNSNVINIKVTGNNYAYIDNAVISTANSGTNTINTNNTTGNGTAVISTGNADSEVNLLNQVNFNVVNSVVHDITINIYGKITGNIILPQLMQSTSCMNCGVTVNNNNTATVTNNANSQAVSGQNTITTNSGSSNITTGNAQSNVNILNVVNTNVINGYIEALFLNDLGLWNGNFLGWDNLAPQTGGQNLALVTGGSTGTGSGNGSVAIDTHNNANVVNNVNATANSGGNTINGSNGTINTGNAHSVVSIDNFVNDTIFGSLIGIFHINILDGDFTGDIGDPSKFVTPTPTTNPEPSSDTANSSNNSGGSCNANNAGVSIDASNNAGVFVNPGDTITFFVTIINTGNTDLTNTNLKISLIKDGVDLGDPTFSIGTLGVGKTVKVTAGLKLSNNAQPGNYQAKATVSTNTCDSNTNPSASSTTNFVVGGILSAGTSLIAQAEAAPPTHHAVLGKSINLTNGIACSSCTWWQILLGEAAALIAYYLLIDPWLKYKRKMWTVLLIPILTYVVFIFLNKSCALATPWFAIWKWQTHFDGLECKFFWALDLILFALIAAIKRKVEKIRNSRQKKVNKLQ